MGSGVWCSVQAGLSVNDIDQSQLQLQPQATAVNKHEVLDPERVPLPGRVLHGHQCGAHRGVHPRRSRGPWQRHLQPLRRSVIPAQAEAAQEAPVLGLREESLLPHLPMDF